MMSKERGGGNFIPYFAGSNWTYAIFRQLRTQINPPTTKHSSWWFVRPCEVWKMIMLCMGPGESKTGGFRRWWKSVLFGTSRFHVGLGWVFYLGRITARIEWTMTGCIGSWRLVSRERERERGSGESPYYIPSYSNHLTPRLKTWMVM